RTVLCATDLSEAATEAIDQAAALALRENAALVVLHVIGVPVVVPSTVGEVVPPMVDPEILYARAEEALGRQLAARPAAARASRQVIRASGPIADEILQRAASLRADLLVMASHQQSAAERVLLGSTAGDVVRRARCPVLVARRSGHRGKVVVATDLSLASLAAMRAAGEEARRRQARLIALHALDLPPPSGSAGAPCSTSDGRLARGMMSAGGRIPS